MTDTNNFSLRGVGTSIRLGKGGGVLSYSGGEFSVFAPNGSALTNIAIAAPVGSNDATTKAYVDNAIQTASQGLDAKGSVRAATTANITLSGTQTIDGVAVIAGDRVLVKNQTDATENGIWVAAAGAWSRSADMDTPSEVTSAYTFVEEGSQAGKGYVVVGFVTGDTIGVNNINWTQFSQSGAYTAGSGLNLSSGVFSVGAGAGITVGSNFVAINLASGNNVLNTTSGLALSSNAEFTQTGGTLALATSGVTAGTYGDATHPAIITVDSKGRVTSASTGAIALGTGSVTSVVSGKGLASGTITNAGTLNLDLSTLDAAGALGTADLFAVSQSGTTVRSTLQSLAAFFASNSVAGTGAIHTASGTVSLTTDSNFVQTGGTLSLAANVAGLNSLSITNTGSAQEALSVLGGVRSTGPTQFGFTTGTGGAIMDGIANGTYAFARLGYIPGTTGPAGITQILAGTGDAIGTFSNSGLTVNGGTFGAGNITASGTVSGTAVNSTGTMHATGNITGANLSGTNTGDQTITLTGDVTGSGTGSFAATLATVNSNVGTFNGFVVNGKGLVTSAANIVASGDATGTVSGTALALTLANSGVTAGTYGDQSHPAIITVDAKGRVTSASTGTVAFGTGSVTSVVAGAGLTGGTITNSGTIALGTTLGGTGAGYSAAIWGAAVTGTSDPGGNAFSVTAPTFTFDAFGRVTTIGSSIQTIKATGGLGVNGTGGLYVLIDGSSLSATNQYGLKVNSFNASGIVSTGTNGVELKFQYIPSGTAQGTDSVIIDNNGTVKQVSVSTLVNSVVVAQKSAVQATIGSGLGTQTIGTIPTYGTSLSAVAKVVMKIGTALAGATTAQVLVGTNVVMTVSENDVTTAGLYIADLALDVNGAGDVVTVVFDSAPTAGTGLVTVKFDVI